MIIDLSEALPLGKAIQFIKTASESEIRSFAKNGTIKAGSSLPLALRSLQSSKIEDAFLVCRALVESIARNLEDSKVASKSSICFLWLKRENLDTWTQAMIQILQTKDEKMLQIGALTLVERLGAEAKRSAEDEIGNSRKASLIVDLSGSTDALPLLDDANLLSNFVRPCVEIAIGSSSTIADESNLEKRKLPTRLSLSAAKCATTLCNFCLSVISGCESDESGAPKSNEIVGEFSRLLEELREWHQKPHPLFCTALGCLQRQLEYRMREGNANMCAQIVDLCSGHLSEDAKGSSKNRDKARRELAAAVSDAAKAIVAEKMQQVDNDQQTVGHLLFIALAIGRLSPKSLDKVFEEVGPVLIQGAVYSLSCSLTDVKDLAVGLVRIGVARMISTPPAIEDGDKTPANASTAESVVMELFPQVLAMLSSDDGTSMAAVAFASELCVLYPSSCLSLVVESCTSDTPLVRKNAILIIDSVFKHASVNAVAAPDLTRHLSAALLARLSDEAIAIRSLVTDTLVHAPKECLPSLCRSLYSPDDRHRSAAGRAVVGILEAHCAFGGNTAAAIIDLLIDTIRDPFSPTALPVSPPRHPGDIGSQKDKAPPVRDVESDWPSRVIDLTSKWAPTGVTPTSATALANVILRKTMGAPEDIVIIKFLSKILPFVTRYPEASRSIVTRLVEEIDSVTKLKGTADGLLFATLAPLLILKMFSASSLKAVSDFHLDSILTEIMCDPNRPIQIRKVAAEIFSKLDETSTFVAAVAAASRALSDGDLDTVKIFLLSVCFSLQMFPLELKQNPSHLEMVRLCMNILRLPLTGKSDDGSVIQLQRGAIDALAFLLIAADLHPNSMREEAPTIGGENATDVTPKLIQEMDASESCSPVDETRPASANLSKSILGLLVFSNVNQYGCERDVGVAFGSVDLPQRVCLANVLISICNISRSPTLISEAMSIWGSAIFHGASESTEDSIKSACLQILFIALFQMEKLCDPWAVDALAIARSVLASPNPQIRSAAIKVIGVCLTHSSEHIAKVDSSKLVQIQRALEGTANIDPEPQVRSLAQTILQASFGS